MAGGEIADACRALFGPERYYGYLSNQSASPPDYRADYQWGDVPLTVSAQSSNSGGTYLFELQNEWDEKNGACTAWGPTYP